MGSFFDCSDRRSAVECEAKIFGSLCPLDVIVVNLYFLTGLDEFACEGDGLCFLWIDLKFPFLEVFC